MNISELEKELELYLNEEYRKDPTYRLAICMSQIGSLAAHLTHDPHENPLARPFNTKDGEISDFGHAVIQLLIYGKSRGIVFDDAIELAMTAIRDKDWMKRKPTSSNSNIIHGTIACPGRVRGYAVMFPSERRQIPEGLHRILVAEHPSINILSPENTGFQGIVTNQGGVGCHAAIVARERRIPCIVGTGNATQRINHGDIIEIDATGIIGLVVIHK